MIHANISTFIGQMEAEHYYCRYAESPAFKISPHLSAGSRSPDLLRELTDPDEVAYLTKKDRYCGISLGDTTSRFQSIEQIHEELLKQFPNTDIETFKEGLPFKDMLIVKDGVNIGYKGLGEIWLDLPASCWQDLLPPDNEIVVKCSHCGTVHEFRDLVMDEYSVDNRTLLKFTTRGYEMADRCCKFPQLIRNFIL